MEYKKIEVLLTKNGVTAYRMCKDLGLHTSSVTAWRKGDYKPSVTTLKKIADYFGVTVDYFLQKGTSHNEPNSNQREQE